MDIGSRTIKMVLLVDGWIEHWEVVDATSRPSAIARKLLDTYSGIPVVATGYGRDMLERDGVPSITEIKACARGVYHRCNDARMIIDIGGQDVKVIALDVKGRVAKFEMNDRCAAGTGRFLEIMAEKLNVALTGFGRAALQGRERIKISSLCTVFAESEVIGLLNRDEPLEDIAFAVHQSAVRKIAGMYKRISSSSNTTVHLVGGGALNCAIGALLAKELNVTVCVPDNPQILVALGAGIIASER